MLSGILLDLASQPSCSATPMSTESHAELVKSISLLSGLLQNFYQPSRSHQLPDKLTQEWRLLQSITTLLTAGDPLKDREGSRVVVATYSMTNTHVEALIARSSLPGEIENNLHSPTLSSVTDSRRDPDDTHWQMREHLRRWERLRFVQFQAFLSSIAYLLNA